MKDERIYVVSSKYQPHGWEHSVYWFRTEEEAEEFLHREQGDFREREIMTRKEAEALAGKAKVDNAIDWAEFTAWEREE